MSGKDVGPDMGGLLYTVSGNTATVKGFSSTSASSGYTNLTIPATATISSSESYTVTAIGNQAFTLNAQYFKTCTIEEGIKTIGAQAFGGMKSLETLTIPASVTTIGAQVFMGASNLKTVIMKGKTAPSISSFGNNSGYKIIVPYGSLNAYKTKWASYTSEVALLQEAAPGAGEEFTSGDFKYQVNDDGTTATIIGYTGNATELTLGGSVTCNGQSYKVTKTDGTIFVENNTLTTATIANGVTEIGYGLFEEAEALKTVTIPASVTTIGEHAFDWCQKLESVTISKNSKLTTIGTEAFSGCKSLKEFTIPSNVTTISQEAFNGCSGLESVTIEENSKLTTIEYKAFGNCTSLKEFTILTTTPPALGDQVFDQLPSDCKIYVPASAVETYKTTWANYAEHIYAAPLQVGESYTDANNNLVYTNISNDATQKVSVDLKDATTTNIPAFINIYETDYQVTKITYSGSAKISTLSIPAGVEEIDDNVFTNVDKITVPYSALNSYKTKWATYAEKFSPAYSAAKQLTDATAIADAEGYYEAGILTYKRTFDEAGQYATLCLPFETNLSDLASAFEAVYVPQGNIIHYTGDADAALSGKFILLLEKQGATGTIAAGQPFFVKTKEDAQEVTLKNAGDTELNADAAPTTTSMKVLDWDGKTGLMTSNNDIEVSYGSTYQSEEPNGRYTFNTDGSFGIQTEGSILPFRMQLTVTNNSISQNAPMLFSIGTGNGSTTGINQIFGSNQPASAGKVYGIDGRLVNNTGATQGLAKGVYVKNGKKFIIK